MPRRVLLAALLIAIGTTVAAQSLRLRIAVTGGASSTLSAADITFSGYINIPQTAYTYDGGGATGRTVGGHPHIIFGGKNGHASTGFAPVYEVDVNGLTPNTVLASAPTASLYADWDDPSHGQIQSWYDSNCTHTSVSGANSIIPTGMYYNPNNNYLYYTWISSYTTPMFYNAMASSLDAVVGGAGSTTVIGGPWRFSSTEQYNSAVNNGGQRSSYLGTDPNDGSMLVGGNGYANTAKSWGPNLWTGGAFPTGGTAGGCNSAFINSPSEYLEYYEPDASYPSGTPGQIDPWTGLVVNGEIGQLKFPSSFLTSVYQRKGDTTTQISSATGYIIMNDISTSNFIGWFNGVHKQGVIFALGVAGAHGDNDPTHCSTSRAAAPPDGVPATASMSAYLQNGNGGWLHFSSFTGTPSGTFHGGTSGVDATVVNVGSLGNHSVAVFSDRTGTWTTGETITATGFSGVMDYWSDNGSFDNPTLTSGKTNGCACNPFPDLCATGPSTTYLSNVLVVYSASAVASVKAGMAVDYRQVPDTMIDLRQSPYSMTDIRTSAPNGPSPLGGWIDTTTNKLYVVYGSQVEVHGTGDYPVIAVFALNDSAPPAPFPTGLYALTALLTGWALLKENKVA